MARGNDQAQDASKTANANSKTFMGNSNALYSTLAPQLQSEVAHPAGLAPADLAGLETGAQQSAGGTQAAAVGQGGLLAARTKNAGAAPAAIADASRSAGETLSKNLLGIRTGNAQLKEHQRQSGLTGLENLTGLETGASNNALGQVANNVNANTKAAEQSWDWARTILDPALAAAGQGAGAIAGACWIAEALYGMDDDRTHLVRSWLNGPFRETTLGNLVMDVYVAIGRPVAWAVRRSEMLRRIFRPLFDRALAKARQ